MPAPFDPENSRIRFGLTANGTFHVLGLVTDWDMDSDGGEPRRREWLGGEDLRPPRRIEKSGSVEAFLDTGDTTGQVAMMTAHEDRVPGFLQICPEGTTIGDTVFQIEAYITSFNWRMGGIEGDGLTISFNWAGLSSTTPANLWRGG